MFRQRWQRAMVSNPLPSWCPSMKSTIIKGKKWCYDPKSGGWICAEASGDCTPTVAGAAPATPRCYAGSDLACGKEKMKCWTWPDGQVCCLCQDGGGNYFINLKPGVEPDMPVVPSRATKVVAAPSRRRSRLKKARRANVACPKCTDGTPCCSPRTCRPTTQGGFTTCTDRPRKRPAGRGSTLRSIFSGRARRSR